MWRRGRSSSKLVLRAARWTNHKGVRSCTPAARRAAVPDGTTRRAATQFSAAVVLLPSVAHHPARISQCPVRSLRRGTAVQPAQRALDMRAIRRGRSAAATTGRSGGQLALSQSSHHPARIIQCPVSMRLCGDAARDGTGRQGGADRAGRMPAARHPSGRGRQWRRPAATRQSD